MENRPEGGYEKKSLSKAKSYNDGPQMKKVNESTKRKSFSLNEAVMSLDLALGRLKKSKLVPGESSQTGAARRCGTPRDMFMDLSAPSSNINPGLTNASLMSMNFSHYELMRNLSQSTSNSEGGYSGATCNTQPVDSTPRDEHLERYFRSVELWNRKHLHDGSGGSTGVRFDLPKKL